MVPDPENPGSMVEGQMVRIISTHDAPSYLTLEDGTELSFRTAAVEIVRINDRWDASGNPSYNATVNVTTTINAPESLRRRGQTQ